MSCPLISVIMPFHNAEDTLTEAVESLRAQTCEDWDLIALDDGSTDASLSIMEQYARTDARIQVVPSKRCGIVDALNQAASRARGALLARMDADDIALPERFEMQALLFQRNPSLALCGCRVRMMGTSVGPGRRRYENWINGNVTDEFIKRELFVECPVPHPTFMMPRSLFEVLGGYRDLGWPEDYDLVMRVWQIGGSFAKPEPVLLQWRHHPRRLSMNDNRYGAQAFRALKRHFLFQTFLGARPFVQWGAGSVGKKWLREWNPRPQAVVDINPRKIGLTIHGVPVIERDAVPPPGEAFILVAVGVPGVRTEIRDWMAQRGYREERDYLFIA